MGMRLWACVLFLAVGTRVSRAELVDPVKRPVDILPAAQVADILSRLPPIEDAWLRDVLDSADTMFYDHSVMIPGYQDSYGDNREFPVGFRPNTINPGLIAVPTGHRDLFIRIGEFHFPFGRTGGVDDASNTFVIDFWRLPREGGALLPVVYWKREPSSFTHRWEWMFPIGTVFGEMIFVTDASNSSHIFEIRTRTRIASGWTSDAFRPFVTADDFARALERKRMEKAAWSSSPAVNRLIQFLRDNNTLKSTTLKASHYTGASSSVGSSFPAVNGAVDPMPAVEDESFIAEMLHETPFRSAKGATWKQSGSLTAYAASTQASFHIVPRNYNAAVFEVSDAFCTRCHQDAGRPFRDYYPQVMLYGELWGEDDTFSWHPFDAQYFVDKKGAVVNFSSDNRKLRKDFVDAGLIVPYNTSVHTAARYQKIVRPWKNYIYN